MQVDTGLKARAWDDFVAGHPNGHLLQSWSWGAFRDAWGWHPRRVALTGASGEPVASAQVLLRPTPLGPYGYVPRGPVCSPTAPEAEALFSAVRRAVGRAVAVRYEPGWLDGSCDPTRWGWVAAPTTQPRSTVVIDLRASEQDLLDRMQQKWRYNLGLAQRRGVRVREGGEPDLEQFAELMDVTARRDGFGARPGAYYAWAWRSFHPNSHLLIAENEGALLGAVMSFHFGPAAVYLYGASSDEGRRDMPNHLLQWEAMRLARADGRTHYDLWGIPDEVGRAAHAGSDPAEVDPSSDSLAGVWGFKRGLGGTVERTVGGWDDVISPLRHRLLSRMEALRRSVAFR